MRRIRPSQSVLDRASRVRFADDATAVVLDSAGRVTWWDVAAGTARRRVTLPADSDWACLNWPRPVLSGDGRRVAAPRLPTGNTVDVYDTAAVWSLVRQPDGKTIVAGDYFAVIGGVLYRGLLRLNANDTLDTSWNPVMDGQVVTAALGPIVPPLRSQTCSFSMSFLARW